LLLLLLHFKSSTLPFTLSNFFFGYNQLSYFDSVSIKTKLSEELLALELDPLQTTFDGNEAK
jgi:hypothetical protein